MVSNQIFASWRYNPARVVNTDYDFAREPNFKGIKIPIKITDIHKIEKMNCTEISIFGYENKSNIQSMCQKNTFKKYVGFYR